MSQSTRKLEIICGLFDGLAAQGAIWLSVPDLCAESDRLQSGLSHALVGDYVRRFCINDPSNRSASPKHFLESPRFVTSDPQHRRSRQYRRLTREEHDAFLRDPRTDWHERPYTDLAAHYQPPAKLPARPAPRRKPAPSLEPVSASGVEAAVKVIKVHELARELRVDHQRVIDAANRLGAKAELPKSLLAADLAEMVRRELRPVPTPRRETPVRAAPPAPVAPLPAAPVEASPARKEKAPPAVVVIDVSNVAREECDAQGKAKLSSFENLIGQLAGWGLKTIAIADASLWGQIDREDEFKDYCRRGVIKQSPARTEADAWILEVASQAGGFIISRDTFRDRIEKYPGIRGRVVSFMVFDGVVMLDPEHPFIELVKKDGQRKPARKKRS